MNDAAYLLNALRAAGYTLRVRKGRLYVTSSGTLPPGWRAEVREYRAELVELVEAARLWGGELVGL